MAGNWTVSSYTDGFSPETKRNLHDLYSNRCSICGQKRESPFGHPEAEAAHIHPSRHSGPDRETNGLLLCRRCHWGFDSGWLSLNDDHRIIVANADSAHGYEHYQQFDGRQLLAPSADDLAPEPRFIQVHRKLFGFDPIVSGDRLTIGGLRDGETSLVNNRRVIINDAETDALVVNCRVTDVTSQRVCGEHQRTLKCRPDTGADPPDSPFELTADSPFENVETHVRELQADYSGVAQKWEWGRLFRAARTQHGLSRGEMAEKLDVEGAGAMQIKRAERVYDMFPDRGYETDGPAFSAIAELQRVFPQAEDARAAYDCIVETENALSTRETRAWVELLLADRDVTTETVERSLRDHGRPRETGVEQSTRRILDVHREYESTYEP